MIGKLIHVLMAVMLAAAGALLLGSGVAQATPCVGKYDIVVGGLNNNDSQGFIGADQRVGYNSYDVQSGVNELRRLINQHRRDCPGDHVSITAHSGGAAAAHVYVSQDAPGNANAVLLADPKRAAGPGGPGFAQTDWPFNTIPPLAGSDANFRGVPVLTICNANDHICNSQSDWGGYFAGSHGAYDFDVNHYSTTGSGVIFR